jgi:hypothetical protein
VATGNPATRAVRGAPAGLGARLGHRFQRPGLPGYVAAEHNYPQLLDTLAEVTQKPVTVGDGTSDSQARLVPTAC